MVKTTEKDKIKLNLGERIILLNILPTEGDYTELIILRGIKEKVSITSEEVERYGITQNENGIIWKSSDDFDYSFLEIEKNIIKTTLENIAKEKKLKETMLSLYEKFVI